MRISRFYSTLLLSLLCLLLPLHSAAQSSLISPNTKAVTSEQTRYVVVLKNNANAAARSTQLATQHKAVHRYQAVFHGFAAPLSAQAVKALSKNPNVELIEPEFSIHASADTLPSGVDRIDAELAHLGDATGSGATVAIVDTGIQLDHPELIDRLNTSLSQTFVSRGNSTAGGDDNHGHGTHVAGSVAASANGSGVIGVSPSATLIALKVLNKRGSGSSIDIIAALDFITAHNNSHSYADMIHVANFSLGGSGSDSDSAYRRAFEATVNSGCFVVVAAGNESDDAANHVPAAYDSVFTVSAIDDSNDSFASFSNYGPDVDIAAPGVNILSTALNGGLDSKSGTSMASPHVAGAAALYVADNLASLSSATAVSTIRNALLASAEQLSFAGDPDSVNEPLVDAQNLVGDLPSLEPSLQLGLSSDKTSYSETDSQAQLYIVVRNELGDAVTDLVEADFVISGLPVNNFSNLAGVYTVVIDISGLATDSSAVLNVNVTSQGLQTSDAITISKVSAAVIHASEISYNKKGKNLFVRVTVSDSQGQVIEGAVVNITLNLDGSPYGTADGTSGSDGVTSFRASSAPNGNYTTKINSISKDGTLYDENLNVIDPGFTK